MKLQDAVPTNSGVTAQHIGAIHKVCRQRNTFLIVRPSEVETMRLIDRGFATKSMDIHDKSSNWGLTAGMVPVDPRFSKKKAGQPKVNEAELTKTHGESRSTHLELDANTLRELASNHFKVRKENACMCGGDRAWEHYHHQPEPDFCFLVNPADRKVYWRFRQAQKNQNRPPIPLFVWAYQVNGKWIPVTGDYDMWMVAPHATMIDDLSIHSVVDEHGRSAATAFTTELIQALNSACSRADNPVFNHGAEAQNVSFTQELDKRLAVFCPGDQAPFVVNQDVLPRLVYDMLRYGYVATINPKWRSGTTLGIEDMAYAADEALSEELGEEAGTRKARETRNQEGRSEMGSDQLAMVETSAAQAIQRAIRARQGTRSSITPEQRSRANARASLLRLFVRERVNGMTEAKAIEQLNREEFGGQNRGLALTIYHDFHWRDRTEKFKLFRKIADAVGLKHPPSELGPAFPASCFQVVKRAGRNLAEEARQMSATQEAGFGRQRFGRDDEGHVVPIDESR